MPTKVDSSRSSASAKTVLLDGPEVRLYGYWVDRKRDRRVTVPVFDHGYYPRMDHPDSVVRKNIMKRKVTMPSETALRKNGYDVDRVIMISEVVVHPRHEKNLNYFRSEFPAMMRSLARREGITFLLPANDIPSAKIKRKVALNLWRGSFTPLLLKGKQFTSGRMSFFVVPPNKEVITRLKRSLHLEDTEELTEYAPGAVRANTRARTRRNYLTRRYEAAKARKQVDKHLDQVVDQIIDQLTDDLDSTLTPAINTKLRLPPDARKDVDTILDDPDAARALFDQYQKDRYNTRKASSTWVKKWLVPRLKTMLRDNGEQIVKELGSVAFNVSMSLLVNYLLHSLGAKLPDWAQQTVAVSSAAQTYNVRGMTNVTVTPKVRGLPRDAEDQVFTWALSHADRYLGGAERELFRQIMKVTKDDRAKGKFKISVDWNEWKRRSSNREEADYYMGTFKNKQILVAYLRRINQALGVAWDQRRLFNSIPSYDSSSMMF